VNASAADKVVILDRDGTIVIDRTYLADPAGLEFLPGAAEGLRSMHTQGYRLVVISNQSGVGRGLFSLETLQKMNSRLMEMVRASGAHLERIYFCPHRPEDLCSCRKPATKLMMDAASDLDFEPSGAVVIGDKDSDVEFGRRVGATTMLVGSAATSGDARSGAPDYVVRDLREAASILQSTRPCT
jgi:D-glycero-D-manno-heptose 1,7-bisphosphate phosphatase